VRGYPCRVAARRESEEDVVEVDMRLARVVVGSRFSELGHFSAGHASRQARMQPPMSSAAAA
jgi:hypothetical protein